MDHLTNHILTFLREIGISYSLEPINTETFLPGLKLRAGTLIIDVEKLLYPGDILHEAGHLACMPPAIRNEMSGNLENGDLHNGGELMAIGWSYAACMYLGIETAVVFHEHGYKNASESIIGNFSEGRFIGVPLLQWLGMTYDENQAKIHGLNPYPAMQKWLCTKRPE
ncbi:hypothetical protein [Pedobacter sp. AJM]|jgi:hypothetical protein|uniref:hypothetical protein n=1 Tax=Pedobacter sp. AJM TaxID=2003629 RepID=UPI000B4AF8DD|nr:hypothetical protein [Pedobacter sp. AJM]OWK68729.1 hypothetical protein CBW18_20630 [Pedobacter sp. AJM]